MTTRSILGIRREYGFRWWLHISMGRNRPVKINGVTRWPPYAVANVQIGPPFFRFYAWMNNNGHSGSYIIAFNKWTIGLAGVGSNCDHHIWTHWFPRIHGVYKP